MIGCARRPAAMRCGQTVGRRAAQGCRSAEARARERGDRSGRAGADELEASILRLSSRP